MPKSKGVGILRVNKIFFVGGHQRKDPQCVGAEIGWTGSQSAETVRQWWLDSSVGRVRRSWVVRAPGWLYMYIFLIL